MSRKTQVYLVDDSAVMRQTIAHLLHDDPHLELSGSAPNPLIAQKRIEQHRPDVLLLDVEMPGMDGLTFLRQIMASGHPIPTVIYSSLSTQGSQVALDALAWGAVAILAKPRLGLKQHLHDARIEIVQTLRAAALARPRMGSARLRAAGGSAAVALASPQVPGRTQHALAVNKPVLIGSSTGGTQAIEHILMELPADGPGIAITQHMPERFTAMYAQRLNQSCAMQVREARDGDRLERGLVLIAPGGLHMQLKKTNGQYYVSVSDGPPVNRHKPSVDVLFRSAVDCAGSDALALILTGMGSDGAKGMQLLHAAGSRTLAQDEASCVVFGMPQEAIKLGAVTDVLPLDHMAQAILEFDRRG